MFPSVSICSQQSFSSLKRQSSLGQCENIHTSAGLELTQQGVSQSTALFLMLLLLFVIIHRPLLLIGEMLFSD